MKKLVRVLAMALVALFLFSACATDPPATDSPPSQPEQRTEGFTFGAAMISLNAPIWIELMDAGDECAAEYGSTVIWKSAEGSLENQIALIEGYIEQGVDVILIDPIDAVALIPVIQEALRAGIPFVTMGNLVAGQVNDTLYNVCTTYPDVRDTAALTDMVIAAGGKDKTYLGVAGVVGNFVSDTRKQAFVDTAVAAGVDYLVADGEWDPNTTLNVTQDMVAQAGASLGGLYNLDDSMALISMQATPPGLPVAGHNGESAAFDKIESGEMLCTILIGGRHIGYWNILTAVQLAQGQKLPHQVYLKTYMVMTEESEAAYWSGNLDAKYPNMEVINVDAARVEAAAPAEMLDSLD